MGDWVSNKAEGYGIHVWIDKNKYEGEWKACLRHGNGIDYF